jgi:TrmH family RNA methyltransferase
VTAAVRLHRRRGRESEGETLLEGPHLLEAAVAAGIRPKRIFVASGDAAGEALARSLGGQVLSVDERTLAKLATTATPQSPVAVIAIPDRPVPAGGRVLVAWGVSDPGNCGTLIRIAAAFGYGYLAGPESADVWSPKVLRAAAGAHFAARIGHVATLDAVRLGGRAVVATVARDGTPPGPLPDAAAVMVGSEAHGLPDEIVSAADLRVTIPTSGAVESLNAAVAGGIVAYVGALGTTTNLTGS